MTQNQCTIAQGEHFHNQYVIIMQDLRVLILAKSILVVSCTHNLYYTRKLQINVGKL